jgi:hypothetical protein
MGGRIACLLDPLQSGLDQQFSLRAGDQHSGADGKTQAAEVFITDQVGQRFTFKSAAEQAADLIGLLRGENILQMGEQVGRIAPREVGDQSAGGGGV